MPDERGDQAAYRAGYAAALAAVARVSPQLGVLSRPRLEHYLAELAGRPPVLDGPADDPADVAAEQAFARAWREGQA
jgi:hypothetical protein